MNSKIDYGFLSMYILIFVISLAVQELYNYYLGIALMFVVSMQIFHEVSHLIGAKILHYPIEEFVISRDGSYTNFMIPNTAEDWKKAGWIALAGVYFDFIMVSIVFYSLTNAGDLFFAFLGYLLIVIFAIMEFAYPSSDFRKAMDIFENGKKLRDAKPEDPSVGTTI